VFRRERLACGGKPRAGAACRFPHWVKYGSGRSLADHAQGQDIGVRLFRVCPTGSISAEVQVGTLPSSLGARQAGHNHARAPDGCFKSACGILISRNARLRRMSQPASTFKLNIPHALDCYPNSHFLQRNRSIDPSHWGRHAKRNPYSSNYSYRLPPALLSPSFPSASDGTYSSSFRCF